MLATYHNHSTWSDGKATIAQLVAAAQRMGIDELGVSDHFTLHPARETVSWSMPIEQVGDYLAELRASQAGPRPRLRAGLEVDWFAGHEHAIAEALRPLSLDYVIGSVHYVGDFTVDAHPESWARLSRDEQDDVHHEYWRQVRAMAASGLYDIAAHLDLTKKFGYRPRFDLSDLISDALDAIADAGMVVEVNTAGWHKPCADAYPAVEILRQCRRRDIPATISADAHEPSHLLRDFDRAAARLAEAGYGSVARFADRQLRFEPLSAAVPA